MSEVPPSQSEAVISSVQELKLEPQPAFRVERIIKGFEFGHGKISGVAANFAVLEQVDKAIHENPHILVPIDKDDSGRPISDDGCGDGRKVLTIFSLDREFKRSLNRSKVFGGAATMASACAIGMGEARQHTLNEVFETSIQKLDSAGLDFGAHTDEHMHGPNCGCGAIDKAPEIVMATLKYEIPIRGAITLLNDNLRGLNDAYLNFRAYAKELARQPQYSGMKVMEAILNHRGSHIVKQLGGEHRECRIVLNTVPGHTINQQLVREVSGEQAQIFAVDVWRMQDIARKLYPEDARYTQAFLSELIYTLATAAVLTKGDLPVDVIVPNA